jgi:hypothetical protein
MSRKRSLFLKENWDIGLDNSGDLITTAGKYCDAQNVANAIRLFTNDAFLNQKKGVPHFSLDLGKLPALSEVRASYNKAALAVENIKSVNIEFTDFNNETRTLEGVIRATTDDAENIAIEI